MPPSANTSQDGRKHAAVGREPPKHTSLDDDLEKPLIQLQLPPWLWTVS
jgi:hypothetical protein